MELEEIKSIVRNTLSEKRYYHSICVMEMCEELAKRYDVDIEKAKKVGIAHDIAKEMPDGKKFSYVEQNNIPMHPIEQAIPGLLHAKIGADVAKKSFNFSPDMCLAIRAHTTGIEKMDMLAKILYIADWIGKDRKFSNTNHLRKLAFKNINEAIIYSLNQTLIEKINKQEMLHPDSIFARNYILKNMR